MQQMKLARKSCGGSLPGQFGDGNEGMQRLLSGPSTDTCLTADPHDSHHAITSPMRIAVWLAYLTACTHLLATLLACHSKRGVVKIRRSTRRPFPSDTTLPVFSSSLHVSSGLEPILTTDLVCGSHQSEAPSGSTDQYLYFAMQSPFTSVGKTLQVQNRPSSPTCPGLWPIGWVEFLRYCGVD